jgi:hypothetical protein
MEIKTFMGNLPRTGCSALFIAWGKSPINAWVFFITDAMVILPYLKIYHEKKIFLVNLPWK